MNKKFGYYILIWAIFLLLFNAVVFIVQPIIPEYPVKYDARFWIAWVFVIISFIGNLVCASIAFKAKNLTQLFYKLSLVRASYIGLILTLLASSALMLVPDYPSWIAAVVSILIFGLTVIAVLKAKVSSELVEDIDTKVQTQTLFTKTLMVDAESLLSRAKSSEAKDACKKVFEAIRYSDPMSNEALASVESQITLKFNEFSNAVTGETDSIVVIADELVVLIGDRNKKCKILK